MERQDRTKRSLIINCLAGVLAAAITWFFMTLGQADRIWLVAVPLMVLAATVLAAALRQRARPGQQ